MIPNESCVTTPNLTVKLSPAVLFSFRERERRSRIINLVFVNDQNRSNLADISAVSDLDLRRHSWIGLVWLQKLQTYVLNSESSNYLLKIASPLCGRVEV